MSVRKKVKFADIDHEDDDSELNSEEEVEGEDDDEDESEDFDDEGSDGQESEDNDGDDNEEEDQVHESQRQEESGDASETQSRNANGFLVNDEQTFQNPEVVKESDEGEEKVKKSKFDRPLMFKNAKNRSKRLIVVLEKANLEIVKVGKTFELLNTDDHMNLIRKYKKDPAFCRPDITHQCLLMLFDSPLNRAGLLQVYIHTMNNILIEINPQTRFPRTFKRFANLMVQLLYKMSIKSSQGPEKLLRVIKNPITGHLPVGCRKIGTSFKAEKVINPSELIVDPANQDPLVVVIGAMAHGEAAVDYTEEVVSISNYPLSGALACTKIVSAFEQAWGIL